MEKNQLKKRKIIIDGNKLVKKKRKLKNGKIKNYTNHDVQDKLQSNVDIINNILHKDASANWKMLQAKLQKKISVRNNLKVSIENEIENHSKKHKVNNIWFDNVDMELIDEPITAEVLNFKTQISNLNINEIKHDDSISNLDKNLTNAIAIDCEMVGVGDKGRESVLARVSLVNQHGSCVYDEFVKPKEKVTDYRTFVSGIRPCNILNGKSLEEVQKNVYDIIKGRILVGHALENDLKVLFLDHPRKLIRDTARYKPFRKLFNGKIPSLKKLSNKLLNINIQTGEHNSVEDSKAVMRIYMSIREKWEREVKTHKPVTAAKMSKGEKRTCFRKKK